MIIIASYSNVSVTYTADGTQTVFSFPFDYLRKAFVKVEVNEEIILVQGTDYTVSDNKTVVLTEAPESGTIVRVFRETSTTRLVSWADASVLRAKDMTIQQVQNLHILEEQQYWVTENAIIRQGKEWNARNFPIKNVGDPVDPKDATNKEYVDDKVEYVDNNFMKLDDNGDYWVGRGKTIRDIEEPIRQSDGATKNYVDHVLAGLSITGDRVQTFNSVALMKEAPLEPGMVAMTTGYHNPNDGGSGVYNIRAAISGETYDNGSLILLDNGNVAELIVDGTVNVRQCGLGFDLTDCTDKVQYLLGKYKKLYFPAGLYRIASTLILGKDNFIIGDGHATEFIGLSDGNNDPDVYMVAINGNNCTIKDIRVDGVNARSGINLNEAHFAYIENVYVDYVLNGIALTAGGDNVINGCAVMNIKNKGIISTSADSKISDTTVGNCDDTGFDLSRSSMMQVSNCKAYACGKNNSETAYCLDAGEYNSITGFVAQGAYHNAVRVKNYTQISNLYVEGTGYAKVNGYTGNIISHNILVEGHFNHISGIVVDGYFCFSDVLIDNTLVAPLFAYGNVIDINLFQTKIRNPMEGNSHIVLTNSKWLTNHLTVNGRTVAYSNGTAANMIDTSGKTTQTNNGITFTANGDGTFTCNGTATGNAIYVVASVQVTPNKTYVLSGCPNGGGNNIYRLGGDYLGSDFGFGWTGICSATEPKTSYIYINIKQGTTVNNLKFAPILSLDGLSSPSDFALYTGSTGNLNKDVHNLLKRVEALENA